MDDLERILARAEAQRWPRVGPDAIGCPAFVGKVTSSGANLAVGKFFRVNPAIVVGPEVEGGTATVLVDTAISIVVYLVGPGVPATGDLVRVRWTDHRWEATKRYRADGGDPILIGIPGCFCQGTPALLDVTVVYGSSDSAANYGNAYRPSTLGYYTTTPPPYLPQANFASNGYYSTQSWFDDSGAQNYYRLVCASSQYALGLGQYSGGRWQTAGQIYTWAVGGKDPVNFCNPFALLIGRTQPGVFFYGKFEIRGAATSTPPGTETGE